MTRLSVKIVLYDAGPALSSHSGSCFFFPLKREFRENVRKLRGKLCSKSLFLFLWPINNLVHVYNLVLPFRFDLIVDIRTSREAVALKKNSKICRKWTLPRGAVAASFKYTVEAWLTTHLHPNVLYTDGYFSCGNAQNTQKIHQTYAFKKFVWCMASSCFKIWACTVRI